MPVAESPNTGQETEKRKIKKKNRGGEDESGWGTIRPAPHQITPPTPPQINDKQSHLVDPDGDRDQFTVVDPSPGAQIHFFDD